MSTETLPSDLVYAPPRVPQATAPAILPIDKPKGLTSFDVVRRVRRLTGAKKVGHAGTLDPMATGLLIVLVRRAATKQQATFMELKKTYEGTLRLGEATPSFDAETEVEERRPWEHVTSEMLEEAREPFLGEIVQRAPMYSAVKVDGERLYKKARRGERAERPPRQVSVYEFELTGREGQDVSFCVECSKGTYIRSLAHDFGEALGTGAHLVQLRRTGIGSYWVKDAWTLDMLEEALD